MEYSELGIPGVFDVHTHFMPEPVVRKVWAVFDRAPDVYGTDWNVEYRQEAAERLAILRSFGVIRFTSMIYAHKPSMAAWLNQWTAQFAAETPDNVHTSTFFPEPGAEQIVADALESGARLFKVHLQVGGFDPRAEELRGCWALLAEAGVPAVVHCGSGPLAGNFTGPGPIGDVVRAWPDLQIIVAHMGSLEYEAFLAMAEQNENVRLDTTMIFTDFMNSISPYPPELGERLYAAGLRGDVLFGSDFPNIPYPYTHAIESLARLGFGDDWLRAVLYKSAATLIGT